MSKTRLKTPFLELHPDLPGANELMQNYKGTADTV